MMNALSLQKTGDGGEYLAGRDRLDEIRAHVRAKGLHERRVLLALRHHHDGECGRDLAELAKRLQTTPPWHLLVEQDEIEGASTKQLGRVLGIGSRLDTEAFVAQEHAVRLQQLGFIVHPEE